MKLIKLCTPLGKVYWINPDHIVMLMNGDRGAVVRFDDRTEYETLDGVEAGEIAAKIGWEAALVRGVSRADGTNPRALGTNPRALGTNPRARKDRT